MTWEKVDPNEIVRGVWEKYEGEILPYRYLITWDSPEDKKKRFQRLMSLAEYWGKDGEEHVWRLHNNRFIIKDSQGYREQLNFTPSKNFRPSPKLQEEIEIKSIPILYPLPQKWQREIANSIRWYKGLVKSIIPPKAPPPQEREEMLLPAPEGATEGKAPLFTPVGIYQTAMNVPKNIIEVAQGMVYEPLKSIAMPSIIAGARYRGNPVLFLMDYFSGDKNRKKQAEETVKSFVSEEGKSIFEIAKGFVSFIPMTIYNIMKDPNYIREHPVDTLFAFTAVRGGINKFSKIAKKLANKPTIKGQEIIELAPPEIKEEVKRVVDPKEEFEVKKESKPTQDIAEEEGLETYPSKRPAEETPKPKETTDIEEEAKEKEFFIHPTKEKAPVVKREVETPADIREAGFETPKAKKVKRRGKKKTTTEEEGFEIYPSSKTPKSKGVEEKKTVIIDEEEEGSKIYPPRQGAQAPPETERTVSTRAPEPQETPLPIEDTTEEVSSPPEPKERPTIQAQIQELMDIIKRESEKERGQEAGGKELVFKEEPPSPRDIEISQRLNIPLEELEKQKYRISIKLRPAPPHRPLFYGELAKKASRAEQELALDVIEGKISFEEAKKKILEIYKSLEQTGELPSREETPREQESRIAQSLGKTESEMSNLVIKTTHDILTKTGRSNDELINFLRDKDYNGEQLRKIALDVIEQKITPEEAVKLTDELIRKTLEAKEKKITPPEEAKTTPTVEEVKTTPVEEKVKTTPPEVEKTDKTSISEEKIEIPPKTEQPKKTQKSKSKTEASPKVINWQDVPDVAVKNNIQFTNYKEAITRLRELGYTVEGLDELKVPPDPVLKKMSTKELKAMLEKYRRLTNDLIPASEINRITNEILKREGGGEYYKQEKQRQIRAEKEEWGDEGWEYSGGMPASYLSETKPIIIERESGGVSRFRSAIDNELLNIQDPQDVKRRIVAWAETDPDIRKLLETRPLSEIHEEAKRMVQEWAENASVIEAIQKGRIPKEQAVQLLALKKFMIEKFQEIHDLTKEYGRNPSEELRAKIDEQFKIAKIVASAYFESASVAGQTLRSIRGTRITPKVLETLGKIIEASPEIAEEFIEDIIRNYHKPSLLEKLSELYQANLLWLLRTHEINFFSNKFLGHTHLLGVSFLDILFGKIKHIFDSSAPKRSWREFTGRIMAYYLATYDALLAGLNAILHEGALPEVFKERHIPAIGGIFGKIVRFPFRLLGASDIAHKIHIYYSELYAYAIRKVINETDGKLTREEFTKAVWEWFKNPTPEMIEYAKNRAKELTLVEDLRGYAKTLMEARAKHPSLKFLIPFYQILVNIARMAYRHSPLGFAELFRDIPNWQKDLTIPRATLGTLATSFLLWEILKGNITGLPPLDARERDMWYKSGRVSIGVRIGDWFISLAGVEPLATIIGALSDAIYLYDKAPKKSWEAFVGMVVASISRNILDKSFAQTFMGLLKALTNPAHGEDFLENFASSFVPSYLTGLARITDPYLRKAKGIWESMVRKFPGASRTLLPTLDIGGKEIEGQGIARTFLPAHRATRPQTDRDVQIANVLLKLNITLGRPRAPKEWNLTRKLEHEYERSVLQAQWEAIRRYFDTEYQTDKWLLENKLLDTEELRKKIKSIADAGREEGRENFKRLYLWITPTQ